MCLLGDYTADNIDGIEEEMNLFQDLDLAIFG